MLSRLLRAFGKRPRAWEDPDPRVRRDALAALTGDAEGRARLAEIATRDVDASVRDAALHLIDDPAALFPLCERERERPAALRRLAAIAATGRAEEILRARPDLGQALLQAAQDPELADRLLSAIDDADTLLRIATDAQSPRTRLRAAERIQTEPQLVALERASRGSDKNVHRLARERLDLRRALRTDVSEHDGAFTELRNRAAQLHGAQWDPHFAARLELLEKSAAQWRDRAQALVARAHAIPNADVPAWDPGELDTVIGRVREDAARMAAERAALQALEDEARAAEAREAEARTAAARADDARASDGTEADDGTPASPAGDVANAPVAAEAAPAVSDAEHTATLVDLRAVLDDVASAGDALQDRIAMAPAAVEILERRWASVCERAAPSADDARTFRALCQLLRDGAAAAHRLEQAGSELPAADAPPPDATAPAAHAAAEVWQDFWRAQQATRRELGALQNLQRRVQWPNGLPTPPALLAITARIDALRLALRQADDAAAQLLPLADAALSALETIADSGQLNQALQQLAEARRLMRALPASAANPLQGRLALLAGRVQELRDWQGFATQPKRESLCDRMEALAAEPADDPEARADRIKALRAEWQALGPPSSSAERSLADRFNAQAQVAFEPCRQYFDELGAQRAANLAERERVLATLQGYLDGTDWSRADWKLAQQVLRVAREEFMSFSPVERVAGREQGKRFDAAADRLHGLIKAELDRNLQAKEALVARAADLVTSTDDLEGRLQQARQLQQAWRNVGVTPRGPDQKLWRALRGHCDAVFAARETQREVQAQAAESEAQRGETIVEALEARVQDEREITDSGELQAALDAFDALVLGRERARALQRRLRDAEAAYLQRLRSFQQRGRREALLRWLHLHDALLAAERGDGAWPEASFDGAADAIAARRARADDAAAPAQPPLRQWTLYAEILAGLESGEEDRAARLELQVGRLSSSLSGSGRGRREGAAPAKLELNDVLQRWVGAAHGADAAERARMQRAIEAYLA